MGSPRVVADAQRDGSHSPWSVNDARVVGRVSKERP
jgi:hypothetical protein